MSSLKTIAKYFNAVLVLFVLSNVLLLDCYSENRQRSGEKEIVNVDSLRQDSIMKTAHPDPRDWVNDSTIQWPAVPDILPGSILPHNRILAYYGNPLSKGMGILGELPSDEMLRRLDEEVAKWQKADTTKKVIPALHLVFVTAQGQPGKYGNYRLRMDKKVAETVLDWAKTRNALVFLDIQVGRSNLQAEIPPLDTFLKMPNVHLGIDAEFAMEQDQVPGRRMGHFDAKDINFATEHLKKLVIENNLPPKVLIVHRFLQKMITNYDQIKTDPHVQIVMHMDGWGEKSLKLSSYLHYIKKEPVQYTGFKIFYKNDTKRGDPLMTPEDILVLNPVPLYIQYQ